MIKLLKISVLFLTVSLLSFTPVDNSVPAGYDVAKQMFAKTRNIKTMIFEMKRFERIEGEMKEQASFVKLSRNPYKVYSKQLFPEEGLEVLYVEGERHNKALINPNGFPWVNLKLDPYGSIMREDQHHTILDSGYDLVIAILEHLFDKYGQETISMVTNQGLVEWDGDSCWVIEMNNPNFKYIPYTVKKGETINSIAAKYMLSEHMIVEHNPEVNDFDDVTEGQVIEIPNDYCPRIVIYVDKIRMVPLVMKIYDDKGLYEHYEYNKLKIDPEISEEEFTSHYKDYGF